MLLILIIIFVFRPPVGAIFVPPLRAIVSVVASVSDIQKDPTVLATAIFRRIAATYYSFPTEIVRVLHEGYYATGSIISKYYRESWLKR